MNDPVLQAYVDQKNRWSKIFGGKPLSLAIAADRQKIADCIDSDLSPENLPVILIEKKLYRHRLRTGIVTSMVSRMKIDFLIRSGFSLENLFTCTG